jgi:hypothetical protein
MRRFIVLFAALCGTLFAQEMPNIIGHIPTQGGKIVLGSEFCDAKQERFFGFLQDKSGRITQNLCWKMVDDQVFVAYADGDVYTYPVASVQFTEAFDIWMNSRKDRT